MGKSISEITPLSVKTLPVSGSYYDERTNRHFDVHANNGKLYQSEYELNSMGEDVFRNTQQLKWIIGSGINGFGAVVQQGDYLFQAPLSYYSKPKKWGLSPGYEFIDYGFNRPLLAGCIFCHSGRSNPVPATNGKFSNQPFSEMSIGCENCHGPGLAHVHAMQAGTAHPANDLSIVNPAKLSGDLANNICMACHQTGDVRVLKPGRSYSDFRPGDPLDETLSILMIPPSRESPPDVDHVEHYYSMILSKCYRASQRRLRCITCHDPHIEPSPQKANSYFDKKCLGCHTLHSCSLPFKTRIKTSAVDDCVGCHMPKRKVQVISHSSITNHRIVARPDEPFPDMTFEQTTLALPDLIHVDPPPGEKDIPPPALTLLQAYGELAENKPEYVTPYLRVLEELSRTDPENALVQAALGRRELKNGRLEEAAAHLKRALEVGLPQAMYYADLAQATQGLGQAEEALAFQRKAVELDPFNPILQKSLVVQLIHLKQYSEAQAALESYLEKFPQDAFMRRMLALSEGTPTSK